MIYHRKPITGLRDCQHGFCNPPLIESRHMRWRPGLGAVLVAVGLRAAIGELPQLVDVAEKAGLTDIFYCGSDSSKTYIIEALGAGVALLDYDNDGYPDAFFVTGSRLEGFPAGQEPTNQLYRNNRDGTFSRMTREAGLALAGWGRWRGAWQYDSAGNNDLF